MAQQEARSVSRDEIAPTSWQTALDSISLEQALLDFENANARVVDLTQRLLDAVGERRELHTKLELLRIEHERTEARLRAALSAQQAFETEKRSKAYLAVRVIRAARRRIG